VRALDGKFSIDGERIINAVSGEEIPADEPLFLLRARDRNAAKAIAYYIDLCSEDGCQDSHMFALHLRLRRFVAFSQAHPDRIKQPGITGHVSPSDRDPKRPNNPDSA
jgi:hypothetical protein